MTARHCSIYCPKRCLVLLLALAVIVLVVMLSNSPFLSERGQRTFELRTGSPPSVSRVETATSGTGQLSLNKAIGRVSSLVKSLTSDGRDNLDFGVNNTKFHEAVRQHASSDGLIYLASIDSGYLELSLNLYFSSFKKLGIQNYLFVGSDSNVCQVMSAHNASCFDYIHDKDAATSSSYYSEAFKRKTHLKTKIILEGLRLGLKVVITDVDIVFLKDPTAYFTCADCDIEISSDVVEGNSGFYLARPTRGAIDLHTRAWKQGLEKPKISNQKAVDRLLEKMKKANQLKVRNLNSQTFANGKVYFEDNGRMFKGDRPCKDCVILHNNWIVSGAAKIYRFKEIGYWASDYKQYYSNPQNKYLVFNLPVDFGSRETKAEELNALKNAFRLGHLVNRTVILPKFHCYGCKYNKVCSTNLVKISRCTLGTFYRIDKLDELLKDSYRENPFLSHDLVPASVRTSTSPTYLIKSAKYKGNIKNVPHEVETLTPANDVTGPTADEIQAWFGSGSASSSFSVLHFHSLYTRFDLGAELGSFQKSLDSAFKETDFRQY